MNGENGGDKQDSAFDSGGYGATPSAEGAGAFSDFGSGGDGTLGFGGAGFLNFIVDDVRGGAGGGGMYGGGGGGRYPVEHEYYATGGGGGSSNSTGDSTTYETGANAGDGRILIYQVVSGGGSGGGVADNLGNHIATLDLNMSGKKITNTGAPSAATDAATKGYVDTKVSAGYTTGGLYGSCTQIGNGYGANHYINNICSAELAPAFCVPMSSPQAYQGGDSRYNGYGCACPEGFQHILTGFYNPETATANDAHLYLVCYKN